MEHRTATTHTKVLGRVINTVVARERTGLQMSKAGHPVQDLLTIAQNREAWGVLLPAAAPPNNRC